MATRSAPAEEKGVQRITVREAEFVLVPRQQKERTTSSRRTPLVEDRFHYLVRHKEYDRNFFVLMPSMILYDHDGGRHSSGADDDIATQPHDVYDAYQQWAGRCIQRSPSDGPLRRLHVTFTRLSELRRRMLTSFITNPTNHWLDGKEIQDEANKVVPSKVPAAVLGEPVLVLTTDDQHAAVVVEYCLRAAIHNEWRQLRVIWARTHKYIQEQCLAPLTQLCASVLFNRELSRMPPLFSEQEKKDIIDPAIAATSMNAWILLQPCVQWYLTQKRQPGDEELRDLLNPSSRSDDPVADEVSDSRGGTNGVYLRFMTLVPPFLPCHLIPAITEHEADMNRMTAQRVLNSLSMSALQKTKKLPLLEAAAEMFMKQVWPKEMEEEKEDGKRDTSLFRQWTLRTIVRINNLSELRMTQEAANADLVNTLASRANGWTSEMLKEWKLNESGFEFTEATQRAISTCAKGLHGDLNIEKANRTILCDAFNSLSVALYDLMVASGVVLTTRADPRVPWRQYEIGKIHAATNEELLEGKSDGSDEDGDGGGGGGSERDIEPPLPVLSTLLYSTDAVVSWQQFLSGAAGRTSSWWDPKVDGKSEALQDIQDEVTVIHNQLQSMKLPFHQKGSKFPAHLGMFFDQMVVACQCLIGVKSYTPAVGMFIACATKALHVLDPEHKGQATSRRRSISGEQFAWLNVVDLSDASGLGARMWLQLMGWWAVSQQPKQGFPLRNMKDFNADTVQQYEDAVRGYHKAAVRAIARKEYSESLLAASRP